MGNVHTIEHPLAQHALSLVRDQTTPSPIFRQAVAELTRQLVYAATVDLETTTATIDTPLESTEVQRLSGIVSPIAILRSGAAMLETAMEALPNSHAGHFGVYHDKRMGATVEYYLKLPEGVETSRVLLLDPAIGTGKTALACIQRMTEFGVTNISFLTLIASEGGISQIVEEFPDVEIYTIESKDSVGPEGYLVPGMGDFGDRYYGSK